MLCLISTIYYIIFHPAYFDNCPKFNYNRGGKLQSIIFSYEILSNLTYVIPAKPILDLMGGS